MRGRREKALQLWHSPLLAMSSFSGLIRRVAVALCSQQAAEMLLYLLSKQEEITRM